MRYVKTNYYKYDIKDNILRYIMNSMFLGSILGAIFFCLISEDSLNKMNIFIDSFITQVDENNIINFIEIFIKNIKYFIFIWFLGFIPLGEIFIYLIIFCKGFFISFTSSIFFSKYQFQFNINIFNNYILENIFNIILIFFIAYKAIMYSKSKFKNIPLDIKNYIKSLIICIIANIFFITMLYYII